MGNAKDRADKVYQKLIDGGVDVLYDDREDARLDSRQSRQVSAGQKFADADLIGIPYRLVVSEKVGKGMVEVKMRNQDKVELLPLEKLTAKLS